MFNILLIIIFILGNNCFAKSKTIINADTLTSNKKKSSISAKGNVQLTRDKYKVFADEVVYDNANNKIYLKSKTKLTDTENNNIFADEGVISDDMLHGEFKNAGIILNNGISIVSPSITKENDDKYNIGKSNYYFCPNKNLDIDMPYDEIVKEIKENKRQIFSLSSKKSTIDKEKNKIYLNHVFINFFNIPIFYIPYISTSRPFNTRVSGFSSPGFNSNSEYGYSISLPYNLYIGENFVYHLEPQIFQHGNFLIENLMEYKDSNIDFKMEFDFVYDNDRSKYLLNDDNVSEVDEGKYNTTRFYYGVESNGFLDKNLFFDLNINLVNDVYFLRDYYNNYDKFLQSNFDITKIFDNSYISFNNVAFQEIREKEYSFEFDEIYYVPNFEYFVEKELFSNNGQSLNFNFLGNLTNIFNSENDGFINVNLSPNINYVFIDKFSNYFEVNTKFNFDSFNYLANKHHDDEYRLNPELEIKTIIPFYFENFSVRAKVQYFLSDNNNVDIDNFDSYDSELTINNLFSNNRYNGNNLIEKGSRLNYGLEADLDTDFGYFNFSIGQGYRDHIDNKNKILNFEDNLSNILMGFSYYFDNIYINYLNNVNKTNYNIDRSELLVESSFDRLTFGSSYVKLLRYEDGNYNKYIREEQLNFNINYKFNRYIFSELIVNTNLEYNKITLFDLALGYEDECFRIQGSFRKSSYIDSTNDDSTSFNLTLRLKANS